MPPHQLFLAFLVSLASILATNSVEYSVTNNAGSTVGGVRFDLEIGALYTEQTMKAATDFIWAIFQQSADDADRKSVQKISLFIDTEFDGVVQTSNGDIFVGADYIAKHPGDVRNEITGIIYHEMTRIWQWNGDGQAPGGLIGGVADFVRLKSGFFPSHWVAAGGGERWDRGYDVTARFLEYLEGLGSGFVAELNRKMRYGYSENYFVELLGATADELWADYKAEYGEREDKFETNKILFT